MCASTAAPNCIEPRKDRSAGVMGVFPPAAMNDPARHPANISKEGTA